MRPATDQVAAEEQVPQDGGDIGEVFYGNVGSRERLDFTVIGPAVNETSRIAAMCRSAAYAGKYVIVVDDDIDARNWKDVMWAISTRMDPARDITLVENTPIDYLDFASPVSGLGSKIGLDATNCRTGDPLAQEQVTAEDREHVLKALDREAHEKKNGTLLTAPLIAVLLVSTLPNAEEGLNGFLETYLAKTKDGPAAVTAVAMVSKSRISPMRITSGSWRNTCRSAEVKFLVSLPTSR